MFFRHRGTKYFKVLKNKLERGGKILNAVRNCSVVIVVEDFVNFVFDKHPGVHNIRNVFGFHPGEPLLLNVGVDADGYVVEEHDQKYKIKGRSIATATNEIKKASDRQPFLEALRLN